MRRELVWVANLANLADSGDISLGLQRNLNCVLLIFKALILVERGWWNAKLRGRA